MGVRTRKGPHGKAERQQTTKGVSPSVLINTKGRTTFGLRDLPVHAVHKGPGLRVPGCAGDEQSQITHMLMVAADRIGALVEPLFLFHNN